MTMEMNRKCTICKVSEVLLTIDQKISPRAGEEGINCQRMRVCAPKKSYYTRKQNLRDFCLLTTTSSCRVL